MNLKHLRTGKEMYTGGDEQHISKNKPLTTG